VAQGLQLADVVALATLGVDAGVVEARTEVLVAHGAVGQQVPDDGSWRYAISLLDLEQATKQR
jgi:hypothetical protein